MNNNTNNLNQDNYNVQDNNEMPNNQSVSNQSINQGINANQQPINIHQQSTPSFQQPVNYIQDGNVDITNNYKSKLLIIIAIVLIVIVVLITTILLFGQKSKKSINNVNDNIDNEKNINTQTNITNKDNKKNIEDYTWEDLVVSIDGNLIYPGIKVKDFLEYGFEITSENSDKEILSLNSLGVSFKYKGISISSPKVFNVHDETLTVNNIELSYIDLNDEIINNLEVKLPGGLLITENTTIDEIVNSMGRYTKEIAGDYLWELNNEASTMTISFINNKLKHIKFQYTIGTLKRVAK